MALRVVVQREKLARVDEVVEVGESRLVLVAVLLESVLEDLEVGPQRGTDLVLTVLNYTSSLLTLRTS